MHSKRTRGWYVMRLELAVGILIVLAGVLVLVSMPSAMMGADANPPRVAVLAGLLVGLAGLAWMIRIVRGPRDEPPRWRYRDR
jgi:hypothetical protein